MPRRTASSSSAALRPSLPRALRYADPLAPESPDRPESPERPGYRVEALAKGLRILSLFDEQRPSWRVSDLAAVAGLPMPTVYRVVMTLASEGYLDHLPTGDYRPGVRTLTLGTAALRSLDFVAIATPKLQELGRAHGETVNLAVLTGDRVLYLVRLRNSDLVTANIQVGSTLPAVHTSIGKLLLAYLGDADLAARITDASFSANSGPNAKVSLAELRRSCARSATRAGPCRTKSWPTGSGRSPPRSPARTAACSRASTWPSRPGTGPPSGSSASSGPPCWRPARRSPRCCPTPAPARYAL